jgi:alanine dehydrogenase
MQGLYEDQHEEPLHELAIEELAHEVDQPIATVKAVYEGEYARLKSDAKITDYLALFASRRTRETLLRRHA